MARKKGISQEQVRLFQQRADEHLARLGLVAADWSYFEAVIDDWCIRLAGIDPRPGVCFTAQIAGSGRKLDAFISLVGLLGVKTPSMDALTDFAKRAGGLAEQRNRVIHDSWDMSDPDVPKRLEATARKSLRLKKIHVPTDDLLKLANNIAKIRDEFEFLAQQALSSPRGPSPGKSRPVRH